MILMSFSRDSEYIRSGKVVGECVLKVTKDHRKFFALVLSAEDVTERSTPETFFFFNSESEELGQAEVTEGEVLKLTGKLESKESLGPAGIHWRVLKELKCQTVDLFAKMCKIIKSNFLPRRLAGSQCTVFFFFKGE